MTQDEYNNLSPEEQNELTEVHVLGGRIEERENVCRFLYSAKGNQLGMQEWFSGEWIYDIDPDYFHSLDRAFMGAALWYISIIECPNHWEVKLYKRSKLSDRNLVASGQHSDLNQAIMLTCLKAEGVVID